MADQPYTEAEPKAMDSPQTTCDHYYASHIRGGCPIHVRVCVLCQAIDFDDLNEQAAEIEQAKVDALAAAGRLLPEGASMCGHEAPTIIEGARRYVCHLPVGHEGWHGAPNDEQQPWAHWTERRKPPADTSWIKLEDR